MRGSAAMAVVTCGLLFGAATAARADCVAACMTQQGCADAASTSLSTHGGTCDSMHVFCLGQCQPQGNGTRYGVIAWSPKTGAWATVHGYTDADGADAAALAVCGRRAPDCAVLVRYAGVCVAMDSSGNDVLAWDSDPKSRGAAEAKARQNCLRKGGIGCRTAVSDCSR